MIKIADLSVPISYDIKTIEEMAAKRLKIDKNLIIGIRIIKRSVDLSDKQDIHFKITSGVYVADDDEMKIIWQCKDKGITFDDEKAYVCVVNKNEKLSQRPVIVGSGPAGLFAALILAQAGERPILLERGQDVDCRKKRVDQFWQTGILDVESNVQFGEGGAGTFSDGKLKIGSKDPRKIKILDELIKAGAPEEISYLDKPHIGTDRLQKIVKAIRKEIITLGGQVWFNATVTEIIHKDGQVTGIGFIQKNVSKIIKEINSIPSYDTNAALDINKGMPTALANNDGSHAEINCEIADLKNIHSQKDKQFHHSNKFEQYNQSHKNEQYNQIITNNVLLAIGNSARDTFENLLSSGIHLEQRSIAVGVRIEHQQEMIDNLIYGKFARSKELGSANYKMVVHLPNGKGVYTFCMCPGGSVIAATSQKDCLVTNGMSNYDRSGRNANTALLVTIDKNEYASNHPLAGMKYQQDIEKAAFVAGGNNYKAPVQRLEDLISNRETKSFGDVAPTYLPGTEFAKVDSYLKYDINQSLRAAIIEMGEWMPGFAHPDALLTGVETRSSSPVRITRGEDMQAFGIKGLYPCGEGAGYAGGIISAAVDGIRCAEMILGKPK